jgi:hypothetical protein
MDHLDHLTDFANVVASVFNGTPLIRRRPATGGFALVEHAWHLADLETEGYAIRIARLLAEVNPSFADFRGEEIARERRYIELEIAPAVKRFIAQRTANVASLCAIGPDQWERCGQQEAVGEITVARVAQMMSEHDRGHASEIAALLRELGHDVPLPLASFAAEPPMRRTAQGTSVQVKRVGLVQRLPGAGAALAESRSRR